MNKQTSRYTPKYLPQQYVMRLADFCTWYDRELRVIMRRLNTKRWLDFEALVVPTELEDTTPDLIQRALKLINQGQQNAYIAKRLDIPESHVEFIRNMSDYEKEVYLDVDKKYFKTYFYLNPQTIDVSRIFKRRDVDQVADPELTPP